jgi:hypothetical protein
MTVDASQVIVPELQAGESLLWCGQPRKGIVFRSSDLFLVPFSIMWGGFAIFWEGSVLRQAKKDGGGASLFLLLWGIPFVLVGLYMIFLRFFVDARRREHTCYALTDRRAIIVTGLLDKDLTPNLDTMTAPAAGLGSRKVKSVDLQTMTDVSMTEQSNGSGTITFGAQNPSAFFAGTGWPGSGNDAATPSFDLIENVKSVYELIRGAQQRRRSD